MKTIRLENEKLAKDCQKLKLRQNAEKALSDESFRKKVKRLTGELDMLSTYTSSLHKLFNEALPRASPVSVSDDLSQVMKSVIESV